jgi:drug/metabolite transporter (DMT)-like permease
VWLWQFGYVVASLFAFWFIIAGLKSVEASIGGLIGLLEIVFSVSFGIIIFGENLTQRVVLGVLLILSAASLPHIYDLMRKNRLR